MVSARRSGHCERRAVLLLATGTMSQLDNYFDAPPAPRRKVALSGVTSGSVVRYAKLAVGLTMLVCAIHAAIKIGPEYVADEEAGEAELDVLYAARAQPSRAHPARRAMTTPRSTRAASDSARRAAAATERAVLASIALEQVVSVPPMQPPDTAAHQPGNRSSAIPRPSATRGRSRWCHIMRRAHQVVPGQSWGSLTEAQQERWKTRRCDGFFCKPNSMEAKGIYKCIPSTANSEASEPR